jgi:TusE/DsrC/DsvC family sulfur relay protein
MPSRSYAGIPIDVDAEGFFADPNAWSAPMAEAIATEAGVALSPTSWKVIDFARKDYFAQKQSPGLRRITANTGVATKTLYELFPKGPGMLIARISGIPKPKSCL